MDGGPNRTIDWLIIRFEVKVPKGGLSEEAKIEQMKEKMKKRGEKEEEGREKRGMKGRRKGRKYSDDEADVSILKLKKERI